MKKFVTLAAVLFAFTFVPTPTQAHSRLLATSSKNTTKLASHHKHHKHAGKHKKHHHTVA
jgi:hypothetical protein